MKLVLAFIFIVICCWPTAAFAESPRSYNVRLVTIRDTGEVIAVIEGSGFTSVDSLKRYIAEVLPTGSIIHWRAADNPPAGWKKFTSAWDDVKQFCADRGGKFVIDPAPF